MAVSNLCLLRDLPVSWEMERWDNDRRTEGWNGRCRDTSGREEDRNSEEDSGEVEEPQNEESDHENVGASPPSSDDDGEVSFTLLSNYSSNCTSLAGKDRDRGVGDEQSDDSFTLLSSGDDADQARAGEEHGLGGFNGLVDEDGGEPCSKQRLQVGIPELERSSEDEDEEYYTSDDEDGDTSSEEHEEYQDKLYCHPAYPEKVFQALEEMRQCSLLTDLRLCTNGGLSFRAHFLVLAAVSTSVQRMLQERGGDDGEVILHLGADVSDLGLSAVLEFAYAGTIGALNKESWAQIQAAALCLGVSRVLELCKEEEGGERVRGGGEKVEEKLSAEEQMKLSLESIWELWEERVGCDMELEAEGRAFRAHKILLMASSDYFRAMFSSGMRESRQTSVTLRLVRAAELRILLECLYRGALALDWGCVFELTCAALQFQFQPALSLCLSFMQQEMDADTCLDVAAFAEAYGMSDLQEAAEDFVLRHFEDVAATLKFQDLPVEKLKTYLHSNSLCVVSELPLFKAVVSWIEAKPRRRVREARDLLETIQFPLMTFKEFREVKAINLWPRVNDEDLYGHLVEEFCSSTFNVHSDFRTYLPKDVLVLVGGERITENLEKRSPCKEIWFSNSFRNHVGQLKRVEWRLLGDLPEKPRFSHGVGTIKGQLYVVGGRHYYGKMDTMKCAYRYDPVQNSWQRLADMSERRSSFALVVLGEEVYAIGGDRDSESNVESVEVYCPEADSWSFAHPLDQSLSGHAASVWNGEIFISGGFDCRYDCLVSMVLYRPDKGTTYLADMYQSRAQHCMETFKDRLYVAGGVSSAGGQLVDQLACEFYDPVCDSWGAIEPLSVPHVSAASAVLEGKIYVLGGYCQEDYSDTKRVHRYDPTVQCWENMCGTPGPATYIAACVLPIPPHLRRL